MVRQYAYYCGAAVVLSSGCLCLLSHSVWLLATWGVALLTTAVAAAYFSALFITAVMNEDFSCLAPQSLQFCCSSVFKKLVCRLKKFIDAKVGTEIGGNKAGHPVCTAVVQASLEARTPSSLQVTGTSAGQQPSPADDGRIRGQLIDLSQRLHDQFVLPWYLCLSPDGLSHHQLCGVLEDVLLSCWQQLRVAGGLRSLLLDCCDLFSVLALAHPQRHQLPNPQKSTIGEVGPREYDQLSTLSQLVVLRHLPPLLLTCKGLVVLLRDLLTCNFVVPLYLKLCQPCVILQHWAAISASSSGHEGVEDLGESCGSRDSPHVSSLPDSRLNDLHVKSTESKPGNPEQLGGKHSGQGQSSAVSLHQKRTSSNSRSKVGLASAVSQRKMLRKILKHPNPIKIKTMFTKGVVDGMTEEDYKTCYFFNDLPRFIAPLNFHRGTYSWTHSSHKSEPGSPHHVSKAELLVSRSEPCSPLHFVSRSTIQSSPGRRISWSDPTLQLKKSSCLSKEGFASSVSMLNKASIIELNETSVPGKPCYEKSRGLNNINSSYDGVQGTQSTVVAKKYQSGQDRRSPSETRLNSHGEDYRGEIKLRPNVSDKPFNFSNQVESELILRSPRDEMYHIKRLETKHPAENGSLKTKASVGLQSNVSTAQLLRRGTAGGSKSEDRTLTSLSRERHDGETLLAALTTPHSQLLLKKKKLVKMHSFDHFDGTADPSLPPKFCSVCQVQCSSHCTHGASPAVPSVPSRLPCCLRTCRHRSGSCGEVPRRCDNFGCELPISSDNFSDGKLVISSARDFIVAPPLNEPPAQILTSSVSSSNEHPSRVSFLRHPQEENKSQPSSITESLSAQLPSYPDAGVPANYGSQTCLPSGQISRSCLELDSASRNASSSSKIETPITNANIKENLKVESGPTILSHPTESVGESVHLKTNEQNDQASESDEREPFHATTGEKELKDRNYETSVEKRHATLEQWIDSVFESNSYAIETSVGAVGKASEPVRQGDATVKNFMPNEDGNQLGASLDGATSVEVSAASAQASPDDGEELSPVYEEANNLESSIAKLRSLLSERHPHQSGGSGSSVGSSDSDLPPDPLSEVSPSRHSSYRGAAAQKTFMSDRPLTDGGLTEPLPGVEQLPCRPLEGTVEVLEGRDVPRDGRLIVSCSIPATVVERDPCGSPYTLYTVQYDALYVFDGSSSSKKRKTGRADTTSLKKKASPAESSHVTATDSETVVKKIVATTSVHKSSVGDGKNVSCDRNVTIARGSSSSSEGKGETTSRDDETDNSDDRKPRLKCANGKSNAQKYRLVLHTKSVERRFREFVSLHNALWVHPKLRFSLRGVTGPSKWRFLPHGKLDSATVSMRRLFLENYMQILLQRIDINTSSIMRQFLCYDSDSKPGEYRTPFEIDWSQVPDSPSARSVLASSAGKVASGDQLLAKHQAATSFPDRAASGEAESQPKPAVGPEQRPTSLFSHDSSSSITSLSSFREPPHVSSGTDDMDEMNLVNVLDIDNCELNIALTAELQPCAMEEALFEDYMTGDAGYSPDMQNTFSDHHGATVASGPANIMTSKPNLPVSSFLVPGLDEAPDKICREKNNLLVVSEPHCSAERTALVHPFHFSDFGNCVADSLSHALRLPLSYPDVGLLRKSVNTIKDCTFSTFSSSAPMPSTSSTSPGEPLTADGQVSARSITEGTHELSPQTSLLLTSEKLSSVNAETISLCDFSVDDSAPVVTHRRASVEGIGDAEREAFSSSRDVWNSYSRGKGISSGLLSLGSEPGSTKHLLNRASLQNLSPSQKDNAEGEVSINRHSKQSCRTPEESLNLHAASCSPSSTLVPESSVKRPASTFLNIFNSVQSAERPFADYIGVKYFCPNCPRVNSCIRCEGSTVPGVTLPQQLTSDLDDCSWFSALAPQSGVGEKCSGIILLNTVIALLNSQQASRGKASTYVLTEPIVELIARWVVPSITAVIDHKLDELFSEENVANFIHEILNTSNLESESNSAKRSQGEGDKFVPLLEYERFLAALGDSNSESSQPVDLDTLKELLISSLPDVVVTMGLGEELAESVLLLLQDPVFSANLALETINLLCSHLLPQHQ